MKNIIFSICSFLFLFGGIWLYNKIENKIPDANWLIVVTKILIAILCLIIYAIIFRWFAGIFNITWEYPFI